ncbi:MAG TPA: hypothetical protein VMS31_00520 [Pyrinomonadaceae bacterium]|nr:hypothetical protein [Pyrinomonadaceae bacterium]
MSETDRTHILSAILEYLLKNPHAQDTLDGIYQWWLPQQRIRTDRATLTGALGELVRRKLIVQSKRRDSQIHYRINVRRSQEIEAVLKRGER